MADFDFGRGREGLRSTANNQTLVSYLRILREQVWLIAACTVLAFAVAIVYVEAAPRKYQAQAEMEVQAASPDDTVLATLPVLHQTGDPTEDVLTGASLVTTPRVSGAVVNALHLHQSPTSLLGSVSSTPIGEAGLVAVQATASSPQLAQRIANAFVQQTIVQSTVTMHNAINAILPTENAQLLGVPLGDRYGPGSLGDQVDELRQLQVTNNPTLVSAATALLPDSPSSPKTKLTLVAGLIAGLLLGVAAAFAFHALDPRIRREEQIREVFDLPILARIAREPGRRRRGRRRGPRRTGPLVPSELKASSEGFRTLRATLTARGLSSEPRTYLVTGSVPSEGKSTTAINLAVALAQGGGSLILIEADFRRPTFATAFKMKPFHGIEQVLVDDVDLADALVPVTFNDTTISVLAAHGSGAEFADRLSFAAVRRLVHDATALADYVVIDSPPLTAVIDALPFAQVADEVLVVARLDHSPLNKLADLEELLRENGVSASGLVLLGGDHRTQQYYRGADPAESRTSSQTRLPST
jgi:capsular exopolysaccharide synthesis family protein